MSSPTISQVIPITNKGRRFIDMTGKRIGRLVVLGFAGYRHEQATWVCRCDCGQQTVVFGSALRRKKPTRSCGCLAREAASTNNSTHGLTRTPEHYAWCNMRGRCENPTDLAYSRYGGRGIKVCERWHIFENFLADMGKRPTAHHSLDRIDNDGDYCPENCRWATRRQQTNNRRGNRILTHNGESLTVSQWSRKLGIKTATIISRLNIHGWSVEKTLSTPVRRAKKVTFRGESHTFSEWSKITGINASTLHDRVHDFGWSVEKALTTPTQ